jgi:hypothetical protein
MVNVKGYDVPDEFMTANLKQKRKEWMQFPQEVRDEINSQRRKLKCKEWYQKNRDYAIAKNGEYQKSQKQNSYTKNKDRYNELLQKVDELTKALEKNATSIVQSNDIEVN